MLERKVGNRVIRVVRGDITEAPVDAFVYDITADCRLSSGYGGAIAARGGKAVQDELKAVGHLPTGQAVATTAGTLKAKCIVHVNGPKFHEPDAAGKLATAVGNALSCAGQQGATSLAFPPIGSGLYQVPLDLSARVIVDALTRHLGGDGSVREVLLVALDEREHRAFAAALEGGN